MKVSRWHLADFRRWSYRSTSHAIFSDLGHNSPYSLAQKFVQNGMDKEYFGEMVDTVWRASMDVTRGNEKQARMVFASTWISAMEGE